MRRFFTFMLFPLLTTFVWPVGTTSSSEMILLNVKPILDLDPNFIMGMDISMLYEIERLGGKYYDKGVEKDLLDILKDYGINWIRLRVWVDPRDENGNPLGGGNCDHVNMTEIAKRAKQKGLKLLLDFHYSDWWADPGKQSKPKAWEKLTGEALARAIYEYTKDVLKYMLKNNALPEMVQLGNELNNGFLWPDGQISGPGAGGFDGFVSLLTAGINAVREVDPNIKILLHLADGGNNKLYRWLFDEMIKRNVDFDVIGLSFYPYWHGTLFELEENMNDLALRYGKDLIVVETAYAWTLQDVDEQPNILGTDSMIAQAGYKATLQGQVSFLTDLVELIHKVPRNKGLGIFYWEGAWIPVKGAGWKTGEGNPWENQTFFDFNGNVLPSLNFFRWIYGNDHYKPAEILALEPIEIRTNVGEMPRFPERIRISFSDDASRYFAVNWDVSNINHLINEPGEYKIVGTIKDLNMTVSAKLSIIGIKNYIKNASFETGSWIPWQVTGDVNAVKLVVASPASNAHDGKYAVNYWLDKPFKFELSQIIELPNGTYKLSFWIQGGGGENSVRLVVSEHSSEEKSVLIKNTGWLKWSNPTIDNIEVTTGRIKVSIIVDANAGNWAWLDDFLLTKIK